MKNPPRKAGAVVGSGGVDGCGDCRRDAENADNNGQKKSGSRPGPISLLFAPKMKFSGATGKSGLRFPLYLFSEYQTHGDSGCHCANDFA
jgi:hypothetical protein